MHRRRPQCGETPTSPSPRPPSSKSGSSSCGRFHLAPRNKDVDNLEGSTLYSVCCWQTWPWAVSQVPPLPDFITPPRRPTRETKASFFQCCAPSFKRTPKKDNDFAGAVAFHKTNPSAEAPHYIIDKCSISAQGKFYQNPCPTLQ